MNYSASIAPQTFGHLLGEFNWHKSKAKRLFVLWSLMVFPSLISCLFLVGIPATFFSVYFAHRSWRRWRSPQTVVLLYQHGLVDQRKPQPVILPYADVDTLLIAVTRLANVTSHVYTLQTKDKRKIQFDEHLAQIKDLGQILQEQVAQQQLPEAIATYNRGLPISFKQLAISPDGMSRGRQHLSWQDFDGATVIQSRTRKHVHVFLEIKQKGQQKPWALLDQATFPNLSLFFALLNHIQVSTRPDDI
ncbi:hypothetical protein IQ268_18820 [Oculatella sp. LEGE 06141]|uniref:DUF6585 family protein n=1 Tax=Oculatella sp. LEGE 06141 TaxID=1828648 RepID=UPI001881A353|nr:DUF6585 family protein [Oculatella sp. LEGE 06141]MBE9180619.1 hypothetical protein [Oculatella sp. LEGE 06141]